jgi:hypothetical protein
MICMLPGQLARYTYYLSDPSKSINCFSECGLPQEMKGVINMSDDLIIEVGQPVVICD